MKIGVVSLVAPLALLTACGGGDSAPPPISGPSPTPTASPTPTPVSYTPFSELQGSQLFESTCAVLNLTDNPVAEGIIPFARQDGVRFSYIASFSFSEDEDSWRITGDTLDLRFTPDDRRPQQSDEVVIYTVQIASLAIQIFLFVTPEIEGTSAEYARLGAMTITRFDDQQKVYDCAFGVPLDDGDTLPDTSVSYALTRASGTLYRDPDAPDTERIFLSGTGGSLDLDRTQGRLRLSLDLRGVPSQDPDSSEEDLGKFTADIPLSGNPESFAGPLLDSTLREVGQFSGVFFGPQGTEIGVVFSANAQDEAGRPVSFSGSIFGKR